MQDSIYIAVDLGGTLVRAAAFEASGLRLVRAQRRTPVAGDARAMLAAITDTVREVWVGKPLAVGVGAPGPLDPAQGVIHKAPNLPGLQNYPLAAALRREIDVPVFLGNDANLAALAEWRFGAGQGYDDLVYLTISTGIGGGVIAGGRLLLGRDGLAAELGHVSVVQGGPQCGCGRRGHLEAVAAGPAIARAARQMLAEGAISELGDGVNYASGALTAEHVGRAAQNGDTLAIRVLQQAGAHIGRALAGFVHVFNPDIIILGGGVVGAGEVLLESVRDAFRRNLMAAEYECPLAPAALGSDVGLLGALALALDSTSRPDVSGGRKL